MDPGFKAFLTGRGFNPQQIDNLIMDARLLSTFSAVTPSPTSITNIDPMNGFLTLLNRHHSIQNHEPNNRLAGIIAKDRGLHAQMMGCSTPSDAFALYCKSLQVLSTHAKQEIAQQSDGKLLIIDGRIELLETPTRTYFYRAFRADNGRFKEYYFKVKAGADLRREETVWKMILQAFPDTAAKYFVETTLVPVRNLTNHSDIDHGLLSPIMLGTLFELPVSVTRHLVAAVYRAMRTALSMMHRLKWIHCDVKPQNIFRDSEGQYHLADYDACVTLGAKVDKSTRSFWVTEMQRRDRLTGLAATPSVDFAMLAATLLFLADHWDFLPNQQPSISSMKQAALTMKQNGEPGADEVLECIRFFG